jgi:O-6-methylguanine DNA methyltransferase
MSAPLISLPVATANGIFLAHYSEKGLAEMDWPKTGRASARTINTRQIPVQILKWHRLTTKALQTVLTGRAAKELPPLDWNGKTEFQKSVWQQMLKIPAGKTKSYGEVAAAIKNPKAVRAVGSACGANPIPVLVPCHRILAANNKIGGFGGGLEWKRKLLKGEGVIL